jgi:hypothetical protein
MTTPDVKRCAKCGETKPAAEFDRDRSRTDGLGSRCKACVREYRQANRARIAERDRSYRTANRSRIAEYQREYNRQYRERIGEYQRECRGESYYQANRERITEYQRAWHSAHREQIAERKREYQATAAHGLTRAERDFIEAMQSHRCPVCLDPLSGDMQIDHDHGCCPGKTSCGNCVRGVVHGGCNKTIALYENDTLRDPELVELAVFYLAMTPIRMAPLYATRTTQTAA